MNERNKTLAFVGFAVFVGLLAWIARPSPIVDTLDAEAGTKFYPNFTNPLTAKTLEITDFDEDTGSLMPFKVTQVKGIWSIPSHSNYPADASRQMADAAASLIDIEKLDVTSTNPADQEVYGVVDPTSPNLTAGARGVGKGVTVEDGSGNVLAQFIIGKADPSQTGVRFVRIPGQDPVYRVAMSTDKLSTKFEDWIEKDLLKLNAFDVKRVTMNDYSVDELNPSPLQERSLITVSHDSKDSKWLLDTLKIYKDGKPVDELLGSGEEINSDKLNDLKNSLDDLKIIDVSRKPAGLSSDLRVEDKLAKDQQSVASLASHGFYLGRRNNKLELFSNEGEVRCGTAEGVEYVLRFGEIAGQEGDAKKDEKPDAGKKPGEKPAGVGLSRYIMVTTRFNEDLIPKPELQALPGPQPEAKEPAEPAAKPAATPPAAKPAATPPASTPPAAKPAATPPAKPADEQEEEDSKCDAPGDEPPAKPDEKKPPEEKKPAAPPAAAPAANPPAAAPPAAPADKKPAEKPKTEADLERERIEKENKQKQAEYDAKVKDGQKKVKDLNDRFADWYYIISDATYQKIHLGRGDVVKKKEAPKDEAGKPGEAGETAVPDPFKKFHDLKSQGLPK